MHMRRLLSASAILMCMMMISAGVVSCGGSSGGVTIDTSRITPPHFTGGTAPILSLSSPVTNWTWNDPHVIKVGEKYVMYASATDNFAYPVKLYRLVSDDGISFTLDPPTPVLVPTGTWDAGSVETPAVVLFNGKYHLFWTGYPVFPTSPSLDVKTMHIGHAVSTDGISFTADATYLSVVPSGEADDGNPDNDWYSSVIAEPAPVVFNGKLYLYFTALGWDTGADLDMGAGAALQVIGFVTSNDGATWSSPVRALRPDQAIYPRKPVADGSYWAGYSTPNAIVLNGEMHLFFDVARGYATAPAPYPQTWIQKKLHHARSADGRTGWIQDAAAIRSAEDFTWTIRELRSPSALLNGTLLRLDFSGDSLYNTPQQFGIGVMTCDLGAR